MLELTAAAEDRHFWFLGLRRNARYLLATGLAGRTPELILDCGAGTGRNLDWLSTYGPAVGIELSPTGLAFGRRLGRRLVRGSITQLPFADGTADVVTCFDVLYALDDIQERQAVSEMRRVLRPGGIAIVNVAALESLKGSISTFTNERRRYSRREFRALFDDAGLAVERLTFTNLSPFPPAWAIRTFERWSGRDKRPSGAYLTVPPWPINAAFDVALRLEAAWLRVGNLPIGTSLLALVRKREN